MRRERCVQGCRQDGRLEPCWWEINVGALPERVNSGIRPARTMHSDLMPCYLEKGSFDSILDRVAARLTLPAAEARAVVGNNQF